MQIVDLVARVVQVCTQNVILAANSVRHMQGVLVAADSVWVATRHGLEVRVASRYDLVPLRALGESNRLERTKRETPKHGYGECSGWVRLVVVTIQGDEETTDTVERQ